MNDNPINLISDTLSLMNLNVFIPSKEQLNAENIDAKFHILIDKDTVFNDTLPFFEKNITSRTLLHVQDIYGFSNLLLYIPEKYRQEPQAFYLIIGPFLEHQFEVKEIIEILQRNNTSIKFLEQLSLCYKHTPTIKDIAMLEYVILRLASTLFGETYHSKSISYYSEFIKGYSLHTFDSFECPEDYFSKVTTIYDTENKFLDAVANGEYELARNLYQKYYKLYNPKEFLSNPIKQLYFLTSLHTLCRKAAEKSGIAPAYIEKRSQKIKSLITDEHSPKDFNQIANEIIHSYCCFTKSHKMTGYSPTIQNIVTYIDFHSEENLNLSYFSNKFAMNKTYISTLFKKETGFTLTEYVHQIRMHKAITLLNLYSSPITTIATSCGYNDISHFTRIFKRFYGMSPKQYQKSILRPFKDKK